MNERKEKKINQPIFFYHQICEDRRKTTNFFSFFIFIPFSHITSLTELMFLCSLFFPLEFPLSFKSNTHKHTSMEYTIDDDDDDNVFFSRMTSKLRGSFMNDVSVVDLDDCITKGLFSNLQKARSVILNIVNIKLTIISE